MNQRPHIRLIPLLIGGIGLLFAIFAGRLAGQSDFRTLGVIFGVLTVVILCLWLRSSIWLLIPLCWGLTGRISLLPLPFSVRDMSVLLVTGMFGVFFALKMVRFKSETGWLEALVAINMAYVLSMFLRHPVGTSAFGSDMVGGRPYFDVIIGLLAFLLFRLVTVTPKQAKIFPFFLLAGSMVVSGLGLLTRLIPSLVPVIAPLYSGITVQGYMESEGYQTGSSDRLTELSGPGMTIFQILCSYNRPLSLLLPIHPLRMLLFLTGVLGILYSGFRNSIVGAGAFFVFASYFKGGMKDLFRSVVIGLVGLLALIILQVSVGLPVQAQRALSFIPGVAWNEDAVNDAADSVRWRTDMWKIVMHEKKYITDKVWGDGFGFTASELSIMRSSDFGGTGFIGGAEQEAFMIAGAFHSGPLSGIRFAGVVGLSLFLILITYLAFEAPKLIQMARGTPFFATTLFFFMPMIYFPLFYIFIFGGYDSAVPEILFEAGMFRMIKNSLQAYHDAIKAPLVTESASKDQKELLSQRA